MYLVICIPTNQYILPIQALNWPKIRADQIERLEKGETSVNWLAPDCGDCEAGFGGVLNAFEITQAYRGRCSWRSF